jgi:hypothetical protein
MMKALSLQQPWAWIVVNAARLTEIGVPPKLVENRAWKPRNPGLRFRGRSLIHASKGIDKRGYEMAADLFPELYKIIPPPCRIERGGIVGAANFVDVVTWSPSVWFMGPYAFVLSNPEPLPFVPMLGALGFFDAKYAPCNAVETPPDTLTRTEDVVTRKELAEIIGCRPTGDCIPVCAGEWRKEWDGRWRVWADVGFEEAA